MKLLWSASVVGACCFLFSSGLALGQLENRQPEWYLPTADGCKLFVQEFGQGRETLIILHGGWGAEHSYLYPAFKDLDQTYRLIFYDQRGSLLSPCSPDKISVQKHVDDLDLLRQALKLPKINIVAHSMGTYLALSYQQEHPERVGGLVLLSAMPPSHPRTQEERDLLQRQQVQAKAFMQRPEIGAEIDREGLRKSDKLLTPQQQTQQWRIAYDGVNIFHLDRAAQVLGGQAYYNAASGQAAAKTMDPDWDFTPSLARRTCPTWVLNGDHDFADPSGKGFRLATARLELVKVAILPDSGHMSWIDAPEVFPKALRSALADSIECEK